MNCYDTERFFFLNFLQRFEWYPFHLRWSLLASSYIRRYGWSPLLLLFVHVNSVRLLRVVDSFCPRLSVSALLLLVTSRRLLVDILPHKIPLSFSLSINWAFAAGRFHYSCDSSSSFSHSRMSDSCYGQFRPSIFYCVFDNTVALYSY